MADPTLPDGLLDYLRIRDQQRANQVTARLARFTDRERALVREAAVHGYVLGHMAGEVAGRRGDPPDQRRIPPDSRIVAEVLLGCDAQSDLYPLIGEHVEDNDGTD